MADINVQPKRSSPWWLWGLIVVILGVAGYYFFARGHNGQATRQNADSTQTTGQNK